MNFDDILKYQSTDLKLRRVYDEIEKSDLNKRLEAAKARFNAAKHNVEECGRTAEALLGNIAAAEKSYEDAAAKLAAYAAEADNAPEENLNELISRLESLRGRLGELEKRLGDIKARADKALKAYIESNKQGKEMREQYNSTKVKLDQLKQSKEPEITALKKELGELKKQIDPKLMEQYNALIGEGKVFAFVEAVRVDKDYSCRGCGVILSQTQKSELEEKGWCRCETCRRIIYKKGK